MGMDANARANTDREELQMRAEMWEQAEAGCCWVAWSELPLPIVQHWPFRDMTSAFTLSAGMEAAPGLLPVSLSSLGVT